MSITEIAREVIERVARQRGEHPYGFSLDVVEIENVGGEQVTRVEISVYMTPASDEVPWVATP